MGGRAGRRRGWIPRFQKIFRNASIADWQGAALRLNEKFPEGEDVAVILEARDRRVVGASKRLGS